MNGLQDWIDNPVLITVDSLENPLKDIEFPAITICPDFEPDHTALTELVFNLFEYNCDLGNNNCEDIRQDFKSVVKFVSDEMRSIIDEVQFEKGSYFDIDYSNCISKKGDHSNIPCVFPFEFKGIEYFECIWEDHPNNENWPWCATAANVIGQNHSKITDWGNCEPGCPIQPKPKGEPLSKQYFIKRERKLNS